MILPTSTERWPLFLAILAISPGACTRQPPSNREIPPSIDAGVIPATTAVDAASAPSAAAPPPASATAAPLAARAPLSAAEEEAIAHALCGPAPLHRPAKSWGCRCPSYTEFASTDDADGQQLAILAYHHGAFSAPDRDEVVVRLAGCESGASSSLSYGSRALLRRTGSTWYRLTYASGSPGDCTPIVSSAGLTRLICHQESGHMGLYRNEIALLGYIQKPDGVEERAQEIFAFQTNSNDPTVTTSDFQSNPRIVTERKFEILGAAAYSAGDDRALSIEVEVESRLVCLSGPPACARKGTDTVTLPLTFTFDGRMFAVAPRSRRQLERLRTREPE